MAEYTDIRVDGIPREKAEPFAEFVHGWTTFDVNLELHGNGLCSIVIFVETDDPEYATEGRDLIYKFLGEFDGD